MILSLPAYNPSSSTMACHYTQNRKQIPFSGIRSSMWSGPIDVVMNWSYTMFTLAHISLLKILTFTNTSPDGVFASTWCLLLSDLCLSGSFLAFRPLLNCQLPWEAFHYLPSVWIPPLVTPIPRPCFVSSYSTHCHLPLTLLLVHRLFVYIPWSECKPSREETLLMLLTTSVWV